MSKRKHSLVDLTESSPLPLPLTSRVPAPRAGPLSSSRSSHSSPGPSKRRHKLKVDTSPDTGSSQRAIDVDAVDVVDHEVREEPSVPLAGPSRSRSIQRTPSPTPSHLLAAHTCPICFSTITNACLTPCGHVLCGTCLFASVKSGMERALAMGMVARGEAIAAKCPVCRALLKGWDGKGGGIIPLKIRTIVAL